MRSVVLSEHELSGEGFPTQTAAMGFLSSMDDLVIGKPRLLDKGFPAFSAYMTFLYFLSLLRLGATEARLKVDAFLTCRKWNFSTEFFTVSREKGFLMSRECHGVLYFPAFALVNQS